MDKDIKFAKAGKTESHTLVPQYVTEEGSPEVFVLGFPGKKDEEPKKGYFWRGN